MEGMIVDSERFDTITRTLASGLSRRGVLRTIGVVGAGGLLAVVGQTARAADRPHERLQDRSEQRNRKQRKQRRDTNDKSSGQHKHERKHRMAHPQRLRDVQVTLINGTSQLLSFGLWPGEPDRHLGPQERETFTQGSSTGATLFVRNTTTYILDAGNPALGLPHVWIYDEDSNTVVFDERLTEGQQVDSLVFLVKRLTDTADAKVFEVTAHD
jgi:hypothetical protein